MAARENPESPATTETKSAGTKGIRTGRGKSGRSAQSKYSVGSSSALIRPKSPSPTRSIGSSESCQEESYISRSVLRFALSFQASWIARPANHVDLPFLR